MFFSRFLIKSVFFDHKNIQHLYDLLSKDYPNLELIWKSDLKTVSDPQLANAGVIKINNKTVFSQNEKNGQGIIVFGRLKGKEKQILRLLKESGFTFEEPVINNGIMCLVLFLCLVALACFLNSSYILYIIISAIILLSGIILYALSSKLIWNSEYTLRNISSVLLIIGLLCMAPSSLLTFPLMKYMNQKSLCTMIENLD